MVILGIDPGVSGGAAKIKTGLRSSTWCITFKKESPESLIKWIRHHKPDICYLEAVHAMPKQGVCSTFTFGTNFGYWQGILASYSIPTVLVYPLRWQTVLNCRTKGDKNVTKTKAQNLFPSIKVTHGNADALLIAYYGMKDQLSQF